MKVAKNEGTKTVGSLSWYAEVLDKLAKDTEEEQDKINSQLHDIGVLPGSLVLTYKADSGFVVQTQPWLCKMLYTIGCSEEKVHIAAEYTRSTKSKDKVPQLLYEARSEFLEKLGIDVNSRS